VEIPDAVVSRAADAFRDNLEYDAFGEVGDDQRFDAMRFALLAARPYLMPTRDALVDLMNAHPIEAFNGSQSVCGCNLTWRTNVEYRAHLADMVLALLNGES
jgi:hypothetical protein